jgi:uncharacterized damage-inducible protein DinB
MSASYVRTLIAYNRWAWTKVLDQVALLTPEQYASRQFNFGSVRSTLTHISGTEATYLARVSGQPPVPRRTEDEFPTFGALRERWEQQFDEQKKFGETLTDAMLNENFDYIGANGQPASSRRDLFLAQMINHSTQHRAETAVAVTEFGHSPGDLDVFIYVREAGPSP